MKWNIYRSFIVVSQAVPSSSFFYYMREPNVLLVIWTKSASDSRCMYVLAAACNTYCGRVIWRHCGGGGACCCCAHGSEEGCWWLLLPQGAHERRQCPFLPAGRAHPALPVVRGGHLLSPGAPLRTARPPPLEAAAGQLHPEIQGQPGRPAHPAASVRGGERRWDQGGRLEASLGLLWSVLLRGHGGLHYW